MLEIDSQTLSCKNLKSSEKIIDFVSNKFFESIVSLFFGTVSMRNPRDLLFSGFRLNGTLKEGVMTSPGKPIDI